jgi:hypothetical protein
MKLMKARISTTKVDLHNECMDLSALECMVEQANKDYIPVGIEHDPRHAPGGRIRKAWLEELGVGDYGVMAEIEYFESGDSIPFEDSGRRMPIHEYRDGKIHLEVDRSYDNEPARQVISELKHSVDLVLEYEDKKAIEPISILGIGIGAFLLGEIASGFLNKIGSDAWDLLKRHLGRLLEARKVPSSGYLVSLRFTVDVEDHPVEIQVLLESADIRDVATFFERELPQLDALARKYVTVRPRVRALVVDRTAKGLAVRYAIREDAVPLFPVERLSSESRRGDGRIPRC